MAHRTKTSLMSEANLVACYLLILVKIFKDLFDTWVRVLLQDLLAQVLIDRAHQPGQDHSVLELLVTIRGTFRATKTAFISQVHEPVVKVFDAFIGS